MKAGQRKCQLDSQAQVSVNQQFWSLRAFRLVPPCRPSTRRGALAKWRTPSAESLATLATKPLILTQNEIIGHSGNVVAHNPCRFFARDLLLITLREFFRMRYPEPE